MRRFLMVVIASVLVAGVAVLPACEPTGSASCKEECTEDADCEDGLGCFSTTSGQMCVPDQCGGCFSSNQRCSYSENLTEQEEGEMAECTFQACN